jgi:hypothetical protein
MQRVAGASTTSPQEKQRLKDEVVRGFWKRGGRACVADLANELPTSAQELKPVVDELEHDGVLRKVSDPADDRKYAAPYQTVYELSS